MPFFPGLELPLVMVVAGAALIAIGMARRGAAASFAAAPRTDLAGLRRGERAVTSCKAWSPFPLTSPVARKECVFYIEELTEKTRGYELRARPYREVSAGGNAHGAFFIKEGAGEALVLPTFASADINKDFAEQERDYYDETRMIEKRAEKHIATGETVSVLGTPRPLNELIHFLRGNTGVSVPADMLGELLRLEKEGGSLLCFFGDGVERVSDQPPAEYAERARSGGASLVWLGAALLAAGVLWTLKSLAGGAAASLPD